MSLKTRGFAAVAIAAVLTFAVPAPGSAVQAAAPQVAIYLPDVLVTPDSQGTQELVLVRWAETFVAHNLTVQIDSSGLAGVAAVTQFSPRQGCSVSGALLTCTISEFRTDQSYLSPPVPVVTPLPGVAIGASGTWKLTVSADELPAISTEATVRVVEGVDLMVPVPSIRLESTPGGTFSSSLDVSNVGERAVDGVVALFDLEFGFATTKQYSNCSFVDGMVTACVFDEQLEAGRDYVTSEAVPFKVRDDLVAPRQKLLGMRWITVAEFDILRKRSAVINPGSLGQPGSGDRLRLQPKASVGTTGAQQTEIDGLDNTFSVFVDVKGDNDADLAAIGGSATAAAGQVVTLDLGIDNLGPASWDVGRSGGEGAGVFAFALPPGASLAEMPEVCRAWLGIAAEAERDPVRDNLAARYIRCFNPEHVLLRGDQATFPVKLRIDQVVAGAKGTVDVLTICQGCRVDKNLANNTAEVVLNAPTTTLPVTGVQVGLVAGAGALLAILGVAAFLLGRRRRIEPTE